MVKHDMHIYASEQKGWSRDTHSFTHLPMNRESNYETWITLHVVVKHVPWNVRDAKVSGRSAKLF
jgi:hypothetical protein